MKSIKSLLAMIVAVCLMMSLAIPTFATEETVTETTAATEAVTEEVTEAATEEATEADTEEVTEAATEEDVETDIVVEEDGALEEEGAVEEEHDHEEEETTTVVEDSLSTIQVILVILEVIASIALIGTVLMQSGKEAGLSGALSGNSDSYMNKGGRATLDKKLASATKWIALVWILLTLALCLV